MFQDLLYGYMLTQCLYTVTKRGIPDCLADGEKSIAELAQMTQADPDVLYRIMRCLASYGAFNEREHKRFSINELSNDLRTTDSSSRDYLIMCTEILYNAATGLLDTAKTGKPAFDHYYGTNFWDYLENNPNCRWLPKSA